MEFFPLSLPEASFMFLGLAIQALIRGSIVRLVPKIVTIWMFVLLWREVRTGGDWRLLIGYPLTCLLLLTLFWPEASIFGGRRLTRTIAAAQIASYTATQMPEAEVVTAEDTGLIPESLAQPALMAPGMRIILRAITDTHLALARMINSRTHQAFSSLMPIQWLLGVELTTEINTAIADWVHSCYLPVLTGTMEGQQGLTAEELRPWGNTPLRAGLETRKVVPGAQTGIGWMRSSTTSDPTVRCDVYLQGVMFRTEQWLFELRTPKGTPLSQVFQEEFGMDTIVQAQFLIDREMRRAAGPAVPAPSLAGYYGRLRGIGVGVQALEGAATGALGGAASGSGGWMGALVGTVTGALRGLGAETQQVLTALTWMIRIAVIGIWYGPYVLGITEMTLQALFPFVLLLALMPKQQFQPLLHFFGVLMVVHSAPLWYALVDQVARLAASQVPQVGTGYDAAIVQWVVSGLWTASITALGLIIVPTIVVLVYVRKTLPSLGMLWRGGA